MATPSRRALSMVLKQCGDDLTRENVMKQMASIRDLQLPMMLPGIKWNTSADDYFLIQEGSWLASTARSGCCSARFSASDLYCPASYPRGAFRLVRLPQAFGIAAARRNASRFVVVAFQPRLAGPRVIRKSSGCLLQSNSLWLDPMAMARRATSRLRDATNNPHLRRDWLACPSSSRSASSSSSCCCSTLSIRCETPR